MLIQGIRSCIIHAFRTCDRRWSTLGTSTQVLGGHQGTWRIHNWAAGALVFQIQGRPQGEYQAPSLQQSSSVLPLALYLPTILPQSRWNGPFLVGDQSCSILLHLVLCTLILRMELMRVCWRSQMQWHHNAHSAFPFEIPEFPKENFFIIKAAEFQFLADSWKVSLE